jgi:FkbM family methyltransferase
VIYFKELYPQAHVVAFEPDDEIFRILCENLSGFNYQGVELINKGVWSSTTTLQFVSEGTLGGHVLQNKVGPSAKIISISTTRLKDLLDKPVDFLKIDIEGAEYDVIKDCGDSLRNVRFLFVEYHSDSNEQQKLGEILNILAAAGFRYYITQASDRKSFPFVQKVQRGFDLQLNISCFRPELIS